MSVVRPPAGVSAAQIDAAEALVAAHLGLSTLEEVEVTQSGVMTSGVIPLRAGPLTGLTAFTVQGVTQTPASGLWALTVPAAMTGYGLATSTVYPAPYSVTYTVGWDSEDDMPAPVRQAVLLTARGLADAQGDDRVSEIRIDGQITEKYRAPEMAASGLPATVTALLAPFRPVRF